jgi:hypothetical protein
VNLAEAYRPQTWPELAGLDSLKRRVAFVRVKHGTLGGRCWIINGPAGTGKTTSGLLIAGELASPEFIEELDAGRLTPAKIADFERASYLTAWGLGGRAFIVNELDGLPLAEIRQLLVTLERAGQGGLPRHVVWIFTTSDTPAKFKARSDKHAALWSRCTALSTAEGPGPSFAARLLGIAMAEDLPVGNLADVQALLKSCGGNIRAAMSEIEAGYFAEVAA